MKHSTRTSPRWLGRPALGVFVSAIVATMLGMCSVIPTAVQAEEKVPCSYDLDKDDGLRELEGFSKYDTTINPGNLRAYYFPPKDLPPNSPLVVALHGCGQKACDYDDETGWIALARKYKFAVLLPEQQDFELHSGILKGNKGKCFNWWLTSRGDRRQGEPKSIMNMIKHMVNDFHVDPQRIYITGLSAGGAMTITMLAHYPECFAGGAPMAGVPFNCAGKWPPHAVAEECMCLDVEGVQASEGVFLGMEEWIVQLKLRGKDYAAHRAQCVRMEEPIAQRNKKAWSWANLVRTMNPTNTEWPRISIWQGANDPIVAPVNMKRLMLQWTELHRLDPAKGTSVQEPAASPYQVEHTTYADKRGRILVETYLVASEVPGHPLEKVPATGHATAVDPPSCGCASVDCSCELENVCTKGNETGYIKDANICSSLRVAKFWGLDISATAPSETSPAAFRCGALK